MHCKFCDLEVGKVCTAGNRTVCEYFKEKFSIKGSSKTTTLKVDGEDNFFIPLKTPEQVEKEQRESQEIAEIFGEFLKKTNKKKNSLADD